MALIFIFKRLCDRLNDSQNAIDIFATVTDPNVWLFLIFIKTTRCVAVVYPPCPDLSEPDLSLPRRPF